MKTNKKKIIMSIVTLLLIFSAIIPNKPIQNVEARGLVGSWLCKNEATKELYMMGETDYFHYVTRSKSSTANTEKVEQNVLNKLLTIAGYDFETNNEAILGRELNPTSISETKPEDANENAPRVSAFDRFGVSGLKWSSYLGEWKYNHIDPCASNPDISNTNYGSFYDGRLEPKSSHNEVSTSRDPRSMQFDRGFNSTFGAAFRDTMSNSLFSISKFIVSLTIVFVGLAFTDITTLIGITADGTSGSTATGVFVDLFNTIFSGFVIFTFIITALYLLYNGIVKKQIRLALTGLIKTVVIFMVAIIMSTNPSFWIGVPNKIATYGQALVLNSMSSLYDIQTDYVSLCASDVASINEGVNIDGSTSSENIATEFEKVSQNMKSAIGCQLWEQFLFKPWVRGQFGVEYEDLNNDTLENINSEWVGKASVPVGEGKTIDNWALFQLSAQTNAHSQLGGDNFPSYINGVNADWWRIVDALSNYNEEVVVDSANATGDGVEVSVDLDYTEQVVSDPLEPWQSWVGNNSERFGTALIAVIFGFVGSLAPLVFSISSAVMGLGITIMMMTAPIFLLLGTWGGKGDGIFFGWLSALANMVIKRIGLSFLLILSISLTLSTMKLAYEIGMIQSFFLLVIITTLLIKNKSKLLGMIASVDFGGSFNPLNTTNQFLEKRKKNAEQVGNVALAGATGAVVGIQTGQGAIKGARIGASSQIMNTLYQSETGMNIMRELNIRVVGDSSQDQVCTVCFKRFKSDEKEIAYIDDEGNYYCIDCADEIGIEELYEVTVGDSDKKSKTDEVGIDKTRTKISSANNSYLSHSKARELMNSKVIDGKYYWENEKVQNMIKDNIKKSREDILVFNNIRLTLGKEAKPPSIPEPLHNYIDLALINEAWSTGNIGVIERTYKEAWKLWYMENGEFVEGLREEQIKKFVDEIEKFEPEIDIVNTQRLIENYSKDKYENVIKDKEGKPLNHLYTYKDGKFTFEKITKENIHNEEIKIKQTPEDKLEVNVKIDKKAKDKKGK